MVMQENYQWFTFMQKDGAIEKLNCNNKRWSWNEKETERLKPIYRVKIQPKSGIFYQKNYQRSSLFAQGMIAVKKQPFVVR